MLTPTEESAIVSGRNAAIVRAAQRAGFDCSKLHNVVELVNAVRDAAADFSLPNLYGKLLRRHDHWEPANEQRARKGVVQAYRDAGRHPVVPAFVISADQLTRNMNRTKNSNHHGYSYAGSETSIQIHLPRKRVNEENAYQETSSKKLKLEAPNSPNIDDRIVIDLTDDDTPIMLSPIRLQTPGSALSNITNRANQVPTDTTFTPLHTPHPALSDITKPASKKDKRLKKEQARINFELEQRNVTTIALQKIATRLRNIEEAIDKDRDKLRKRWELDTSLQLQTVTDNLSEINDCFTRVEGGIRDALTVINERLLS